MQPGTGGSVKLTMNLSSSIHKLSMKGEGNNIKGEEKH